MARTVRNRKLDSRTARRAIPIGKITHWVKLSQGRSLGYRRGASGGTWIARYKSESFRREERLADADDTHDADGVEVLSYEQAQKKAQGWFLSVLAEATGEAPRTGGYSVGDAVADYLKSLENRGASDYEHARYDLNAYIGKLGAVQVAKLSRPRLEQWRAEIAASPRRTNRKEKPRDKSKSEPPTPMGEEELRKRRSTANRIMRRVRAALDRALETGRAYANPTAWKVKPFENVEIARAIFLSESQQQSFVRACAPEPDFQNLVMAALYAGCRYGELGRLHVSDFNAREAPFLLVNQRAENKGTSILTRRP